MGGLTRTQPCNSAGHRRFAENACTRIRPHSKPNKACVGSVQSKQLPNRRETFTALNCSSSAQCWLQTNTTILRACRVCDGRTFVLMTPDLLDFLRESSM